MDGSLLMPTLSKIAPYHFVNLTDFTGEQLTEIANTAFRIKGDSTYANHFQGKMLTMIFDKGSLRTKTAFTAAMNQMGGIAQYDFVDLEKKKIDARESIQDQALTLSGMVDAIALRLSDHASITEFAKHATVPVINALSDESHPCQFIADMMAFTEAKGPMKGKKIVWLGDYNNVAKTYAQGAALLGYHLVVSVPADQKNNIALSNCITYEEDAYAAVQKADLVVTDTLESMPIPGSEKVKIDHAKFRPYQVNEKLMAHAGAQAAFTHCMPIYPSNPNEVTHAVAHGPQSIMIAAAHHRLHSKKGILVYLARQHRNAGGYRLGL